MNLDRFAWPSAVVLVAAMGFGYFHADPPPAPTESKVEVAPTGPVVIRELRQLAKLETAALRVEKVVDLKDHQSRLHGLVEAEDHVLFVAAGEVTLGVDLSRVGDDDIGFDEATKTARIELPEPEVLATRFDEQHSYVHARETDMLARRNEGLEAAARREASKQFEAVGREPRSIEIAKTHAETELRTLAKAWGAKELVVTWKTPKGEVDVAAK